MENRNEVPGWVEQAYDRGWNEALLDMYCYMTNRPSLAEYPDKLDKIERMLEQAATNGEWLELIEVDN